MRRILIVLVFGLLGAVPVLGQDFSGEIGIMYYENPNPKHLDFELLRKNICLERVIQLNPELDITSIAYGTPIVIPLNEPCYDPPFNTIHNNSSRLKYYENNTWLDEPYYENVVYVRDATLEEIAGMYEVCVDDLLAENILLHELETYKTFTTTTTMDIFIPQDSPTCKTPSIPEKSSDQLFVINTTYQYLSPDYFGRNLNICVEEVIRSDSLHRMNNQSEFQFYVPSDVLPCYNEQGQRLSYYDSQGDKRDKPVYSDLPVHIALRGETMQMIADEYDVCLIDLLRYNGFLDRSLDDDVEIFIPTVRDCPSDIQAILTSIDRVIEISHSLNICEDVLLNLNPHWRIHRDPYIYNRNAPYNPLNDTAYRNVTDSWVIVPVEPTPCYRTYNPTTGETLYEIEQKFNICYEAFTYSENRYRWGDRLIPDDVIVYLPLDSLPCYNDLGQRLYYSPQDPSAPPEYSHMEVYFVEKGDYPYRISQKFNVCVNDLLDVNSGLLTQVGHPTFVPDTRPCYEDITGMPLVYEDKNGEKLTEPRVSENLIYYRGIRPWAQLSVYYNVCENRIREANQAKLNGEESYLGWIIPTDRPPCFDADWMPIYYVCYDRPIDMTVDYRKSNEQIVFSYDGTNCYDLSDPETIVWYDNKPYQAIYYKDSLFRSRAFTAWCYGVSLDEIDAINAEDDVLNLLPFKTRLIPQPTRDCYLDNPDGFNGQTVHRVYADETVSSISNIYGVPYQLIGLANGLDADYRIWAGQDLMIPIMFTWRNLIAMGGSMVGVLAGFLLLVRRKRRTSGKKKKRVTNDFK